GRRVAGAGSVERCEIAPSVRSRHICPAPSALPRRAGGVNFLNGPCRSTSSSRRKKYWGQLSTHRRPRSEEHTSELQSPDHLVCRLLLEKKKKSDITHAIQRTLQWALKENAHHVTM